MGIDQSLIAVYISKLSPSFEAVWTKRIAGWNIVSVLHDNLKLNPFNENQVGLSIFHSPAPPTKARFLVFNVINGDVLYQS
jgi:hypothetical protein